MGIRTALTTACAVLGLMVPAAALAQPGGDPNFAGSYYEIPDPAPPAPRYAPPPAYPQPRSASQSAPSYPMQYAPAPPPPPVVYAYPVSTREWRRIERARRRAWMCEHGYGCRGPYLR